MQDQTVYRKTKFAAWLYQRIAKPVFFALDPEFVHDQVTSTGELLGRHVWSRKTTHQLFSYAHPMLEQKLHGISFTNPIGLAAGFDKNGRLIDILNSVGFGFAEIGSVTAKPCTGNPRPRLYRLPASQSIVVNYGLMNDGSQRIAQRLEKRKFSLPIGISLAPTNDASTVDYRAAIADYVLSNTRLASCADYLTLNLSCPNTTNDQPFRSADRLAELLMAIGQSPKPIFLKLSPDLSETELHTILDCAQKYGVLGVIISNLTKQRDNPVVQARILDKHLPSRGGLSGKVVESLSDQLIAHAYRHTQRKLTIIGCGGVFTAEDAYRKIRLGASLIQLATGMIFQGPQVIGAINQGLIALLKADGLRSINEAIGLDNQ